MTVATAPSAPVRTAPAYRLTFGRVVRSEWIKLSTLRSTWWSIGIVAVISIGISLLVAASLTSNAAMAEESGMEVSFDSVMAILSPIQFTMLLAGALGAIAITGEYSTGMIRSTLTAEPRRGAVLAAKALVVAGLLAATSAVVFGISVIATMPLLAEMPIDWSDPAVSLVPILYGVYAMAVFAVIGLSFGFILRSGPGAIAATVGLLFVLPIVSSMFPFGDPAWQWVHDAAQYLPMMASQTLMTPGTESGLSDVGAVLALAAWVAAGLVGSWAVLRVRDA